MQVRGEVSRLQLRTRMSSRDIKTSLRQVRPAARSALYQSAPSEAVACARLGKDRSSRSPAALPLQVQRDSAQQAEAITGLAEGSRHLAEQLCDTEALVAALQGTCPPRPPRPPARPPAPPPALP